MLIKDLKPGTVYRIKDTDFFQNKMMVIEVPYDIKMVDAFSDRVFEYKLASIDLERNLLVQWYGHEQLEAVVLEEGDE